MHQKHRTVVELGQQIFGAAAERRDPMALHACSEAPREREAQAAPTKLDPFDRRPFEHRLKPAPDRLHFGKLGHRSETLRVACVACQRTSRPRSDHYQGGLSCLEWRMPGDHQSAATLNYVVWEK